MKAMIDKIEYWSKQISILVSYLNIVIIGIVTFEVISRYVFNSPTLWSWVVNQHLFGVTVLFGGIYAFLTNSHIRIEIFYLNFSPFIKGLSSLLTLILFIIFITALIWKGGLMAYMAISYKEVTKGLFQMPVYPLKALIPIAAALFLIVGVIHILKEKRD